MKNSSLLSLLITSCLLLGGTSMRASNTGDKKINFDSIPYFEAQTIYLTDENGEALLNSDGTRQYRVLLIDQFGRYRSQESVKKQHKAINKAIGNIIGKVGIGTLLGAAAGYFATKDKSEKTEDKVIGTVAGAAAGAAVGLAYSEDDRKQAKKHRESLKEQEQLLKAYQKNFTSEGRPVKASVDLSNVKGLDFTKNEPLSMSAEEVKKEIESEDFNSADTSAWDF